ncbi:hypothetical protein QQ045_015736 [Rhodiola kirilowii]
MAAALTLRRTVSPSLVTKLFSTLRPAHFAPAATRSFNSDAQMSCFDDDDSESGDERPFAHHRDRVPSRRAPFSFSDVFGLSPVDHQPFMANPFLATGARRGWDVKEDKDGLYLRMDMPGLGKENVKVSVEQNTLVIKGEGNKETDDDEEPRRYSNRIDLPERILKLDGIKAEMKNGVLKVMVPKLKAEERTDVRQVQIQ